MHAIKMIFLKDIVKPVRRKRLQQHFLMTGKMYHIHPWPCPKVKVPLYCMLIYYSDN